MILSDQILSEAEGLPLTPASRSCGCESAERENHVPGGVVLPRSLYLHLPALSECSVETKI